MVLIFRGVGTNFGLWAFAPLMAEGSPKNNCKYSIFKLLKIPRKKGPKFKKKMLCNTGWKVMQKYTFLKCIQVEAPHLLTEPFQMYFDQYKPGDEYLHYFQDTYNTVYCSSDMRGVN